jgi:hypothetical protein
MLPLYLCTAGTRRDTLVPDNDNDGMLLATIIHGKLHIMTSEVPYHQDVTFS